MIQFMIAAQSAGEILGDAGLTIVIGLVVVFAVLLLLTGIFKLFGIGMSALQQTQPQAETALPTPAPVQAAPAADIGPILSSTQVRNGISSEETAVIAAAVAASMPAGTRYEIRKIDLAD